jgi:hypothetical protein
MSEGVVVPASEVDTIRPCASCGTPVVPTPELWVRDFRWPAWAELVPDQHAPEPRAWWRLPRHTPQRCHERAVEHSQE